MRELRDYYDRLYAYTAGLDLRRFENAHRIKVFLGRELARVIGGFLAGERPAAVLDAGCGRGDNLITVGRAFRPPLLVGVDFSWRILSFARLRLEARGDPPARLVLGDVQALPFRPGSFTAALGTELLEHLPDDRKGMAEICRALRPGGCFIGSVPARARNRIPGAAGLSEVLRKGVEVRDGGGHFRRYSPSELFQRLQEAGLATERWQYHGKYFYRLAQRLNRRCIALARKFLGTKESKADPYLTTRLSSPGPGTPNDMLVFVYSRCFLPLFNFISDLDRVFQRRRPGTGIMVKARKMAP